MNALTRVAVQGAACGLMIGVVLLIGGRVWWAQPKQPAVADVLRARRFMVQDEAGKLRASLGDDGLTLFDAAEKVRANLDFNASAGSFLRLWGAAEYGMAEMSVSTPGGPSLSLYAPGGLRARLFLFNGGSNLNLYDAAGRQRAALMTTSLGTASAGETTYLVFFDKNGKVMWQAP